jgi:hypothetical protein
MAVSSLGRGCNNKINVHLSVHLSNALIKTYLTSQRTLCSLFVYNFLNWRVLFIWHSSIWSCPNFNDIGNAVLQETWYMYISRWSSYKHRYIFGSLLPLRPKFNSSLEGMGEWGVRVKS